MNNRRNGWRLYLTWRMWWIKACLQLPAMLMLLPLSLSSVDPTMRKTTTTKNKQKRRRRRRARGSGSTPVTRVLSSSLQLGLINGRFADSSYLLLTLDVGAFASLGVTDRVTIGIYKSIYLQLTVKDVLYLKYIHLTVHRIVPWLRSSSQMTR